MGKTRKSGGGVSAPSESNNNITANEFLESEDGASFKNFLEQNNLVLKESVGELIRVIDNSLDGLVLNINSNFLKGLYQTNNSDISDLIDYRNKPDIIQLQIKHLLNNDYGNEGFSINYTNHDELGGEFRWIEGNHPHINIFKGNIQPNILKYGIRDVMSHELGHALDFDENGIGRISQSSRFDWLTHNGSASAYAHTYHNYMDPHWIECAENWADSVKIVEDVRVHGVENTVVDNPEHIDQTDFIPYTEAIEHYAPREMYGVANKILSCKNDAELREYIDELNEW